MRKKLEIGDIAPACGHYALTDALFLRGYEQLLEGDLTDKKILEICCGKGDLAGWLGHKTKAEIVGLDISEQAIQTAVKTYGHLGNVSFVCGDVLNLSGLEPCTFDLIVGQAAMHHLAHDLARVSKELSRLLKSGGRLLFLFEPLGHNPVVAAIRAIRVARNQWLDESNLFDWAIKDFALNYARYEVQYFSLFAYFCKALPKRFFFSRWIYRLLENFDQMLFSRWSGIRKYAANFNVCYWK